MLGIFGKPSVLRSWIVKGRKMMMATKLILVLKLRQAVQVLESMSEWLWPSSTGASLSCGCWDSSNRQRKKLTVSQRSLGKVCETGTASEQKRIILGDLQHLVECWGISVYCEPSNPCSMQFPNARPNPVAHCLKAMLAKYGSTGICCLWRPPAPHPSRISVMLLVNSSDPCN